MFETEAANFPGPGNYAIPNFKNKSRSVETL